ncbi:hypothetical protein [Haladaptatus sp. ZSTT2]|uniref:hypothetical protein n=1 Tax=Haladaptatus sp. ZSTT2 TaxID=3120515 RepID=UPI00300E9AF3
MVSDAGADSSGHTSILPLLEEYASDDTVLYFPNGRYLMDDLWAFPAFSNFGIVGEAATIVPPEGYNRYLFNIGSIEEESGTDFLFENMQFDFRAKDTAPRPLQVAVTDGLIVRDVVVMGMSGTVRFDVTNETGSGVIERLQVPDGGKEPYPTGLLISPDNRGELTITDCHIAGFPGNGLYASGSVGPINVIGGFYLNNGIANVRVSSPAVVRGVHVRCDRSPEGFQNMRGIRLRNGDSVLIEDCTIEMIDVTYSEGAIVIEPRMKSAIIRNTDILTTADNVLGINAKTLKSPDETAHIQCENVKIFGTAQNDAAIRIVDRDNCVFENLSIVQSGANRDGVHLLRSDNAVIRNATISVTRTPILVEESTGLSVKNVTTSPPK